MNTIWQSPTDYASGDTTLQISYPFTSHPGTIVTCTSPDDLKWVSLGLRLPPNVKIEEVIICYEVSNSRSFISQVRLIEMSTPDLAFVRHDDSAGLTSTSPASYSSNVGGLVPTAAVTLELRLNFHNTADQIILGAVGVKIQPTAELWANVKDYGAKGDRSVNDRPAIQAALDRNPCVVVPPGKYRIDERLKVNTHLYLLPGATLIRESASSSSTEPVVLLTDHYAALTGDGWVITENNSPRGVVCVGPLDPNVTQIVIWARIDGIKIKGVSTDSDNVGLNLDSSEPTTGSGANYNGSFSNIVIRDVPVGVKLNAICNGHTFNNIFFYVLTRYSFWSVSTTENTFFGGFTHLSHGVTVIKLESCGYNLFYGVQAEPGGDARYFDVDESSTFCQILGLDNCRNGPIRNSKSLTYLSHGYLSVVNLEATKHESSLLNDPPNTYKPVPLQSEAQLDSQATSVDQLRADFNTLLSKLRASGAIEP